MKRLLFKLGLFFCIWLEIAAELHIDGDTALVIGIALWFAARFAVQIAAHALGLLGPTVFGLVVQGLVWIALFWWWAPAVLRALPWGFVLGGVGLIALAGAASRRGCERARTCHGENIWRAHSVAVVAVLLSAVALGMGASLRWYSLWPLAGYGLLLVLPFGVGWRMVPLLHDARVDARMGTAEGFRSAGYSEER
jgi:hypothetical protein